MPPDLKRATAVVVCLVALVSEVLAKPPPGYVKKPDHDEHPPRYEFGYEVKDAGGGRQGHEETRDGEHAAGRYYVALPDGSTQTVSYTADDWGFHPLVTYSRTSQTSASSTRIALGEEAVAALHGKMIGKKLKLPSSKASAQQQVVQPLVQLAPVPETPVIPVAAVQQNQQDGAAYQQQAAVYQQAGAGVSSAFQRQGSLVVPSANNINALAQEQVSVAQASGTSTQGDLQQYVATPVVQQVAVSPAQDASSQSQYGRKINYYPVYQQQQPQSPAASYQSILSGSQQAGASSAYTADTAANSYQEGNLQSIGVESSGASGYQQVLTDGSSGLIQKSEETYNVGGGSAGAITTTQSPLVTGQATNHYYGVDTGSTVLTPSPTPVTILGNEQSYESSGTQYSGYQSGGGYQLAGSGDAGNNLPQAQALVSTHIVGGNVQVSTYLADTNRAQEYGTRNKVRLPTVGSTLSTLQATASYNGDNNQVTEYNNVVTPAPQVASLRPIVVADIQESQQNLATVTPSPIGATYSSTSSTPIVVADFSSSGSGAVSSNSYSNSASGASYVSTERPIIVESNTLTAGYATTPSSAVSNSENTVIITPRPERLPVASALSSSNAGKYSQRRLPISRLRFGSKLRRPYYSTTQAPPQVTEKVEESSGPTENPLPVQYSYDQNSEVQFQTSVVSSTPLPVVYSENSNQIESNLQVNVNQLENGNQLSAGQQQLLLDAINGLQYDSNKIQEDTQIKAQEKEELLRQENLRAQHQVQLIKQALAETDAKIREQSLKEAQLRAQIEAEKQALRALSFGDKGQQQLHQSVVNSIPRPELVTETVAQSTYNAQAGSGATLPAAAKYIVQGRPEEQLQQISTYQPVNLLPPNIKVAPLQQVFLNQIGNGGLYLVYGGRIQPVYRDALNKIPLFYGQQNIIAANQLKLQQQQLNYLAVEGQRQLQSGYRHGVVLDETHPVAYVRPTVAPLVQTTVQQVDYGDVAAEAEASRPNHEVVTVGSIRQLLESEKETGAASESSGKLADDRPKITIEQTKYLEVERPLSVVPLERPVPYAVPQPVPLPYAVPHPIQVPVPHLVPYPQLVQVPYKEYHPLVIQNRPVNPKAVNLGLVELYQGHGDYRAERYGVPRLRYQLQPPPPGAGSYQTGRLNPRRRRPPYRAHQGQLRKLCIEYGGFKPPIVPSRQIEEDDGLDAEASSAAVTKD